MWSYVPCATRPRRAYGDTSTHGMRNPRCWYSGLTSGAAVAKVGMTLLLTGRDRSKLESVAGRPRGAESGATHPSGGFRL